jgi:hypothetical protein
MALFSGQFVNLELNEKNRTKTGSTLEVRINRKNSNYFNREGIIVTTEEIIQGSFAAPVTRTVWYTEYNPYDITVTPGAGKTISNTYAAEFQYVISNEQIQDGKRFGSKGIRVRLLENGTNNIIIEGILVLQTLELALPTIARFTVENIGKTLSIDIEGVNPEGDYRLNINRSDSNVPVATDVSVLPQTYSIPILEPMYRQLVLFTAQWYLGSLLILERTIAIRVPNFALGIHVKVDGQFREIAEEKMFVKVNGTWKKVVKVFEKIGGEYLSQE